MLLLWFILGCVIATLILIENVTTYCTNDVKEKG